MDYISAHFVERNILYILLKMNNILKKYKIIYLFIIILNINGELIYFINIYISWYISIYYNGKTNIKNMLYIKRLIINKRRRINKRFNI